MTQQSFDADTQLCRLPDLTPDLLYEIQTEAQFLSLPRMEGRVEIERQNALEFDGYNPAFTAQEIEQIGRKLIDAKEKRAIADDTHRIEVINELAEIFIEAMDDDIQVVAETEYEMAPSFREPFEGGADRR